MHWGHLTRCILRSKSEIKTVFKLNPRLAPGSPKREPLSSDPQTMAQAVLSGSTLPAPVPTGQGGQWSQQDLVLR